MLFETFPDTARLWVFSLNGPVPDAEKFEHGLKKFVDGWKAHGSPLKAGVEIVDNQLLLVAADEQYSSASGCSIDALTREVSRLSQEAGLSICGGGDVTFKMGESWKAAPRAEFQKLISSGLINEETPVATPESHYGWTKLVCEQMIEANSKNSKTKYISLPKQKAINKNFVKQN